MLITENIEMKVLHHNADNLKNLGYPVNKNIVYGEFQIIKVKATDFIGRSNKVVCCVCDICETSYTTRLSGNLSICAKCVSKKSGLEWVKNSKNKKIREQSLETIENNREEILSLIEYGLGMGEIKKRFNLSGTSLSKWCSDNRLTIKNSVSGKKENRAKILDILKSVPEYYNFTLSELSKITSLERKKITSLIRCGDIPKLPTEKQKQKIIQDKLENNLNIIIERNKSGESLRDIAIDFGVAACTLSTFLSKFNVDVVLHPPKNQSQGEDELREFIENLGEIVIKKRFKDGRGLKEIDCFVESHMFGIEYCGEYWHRNDKNRHRDKMIFFNNMGISLMTIFESEWRNKPEIIKSMIKSRLGLCKKVAARTLSVSEIPHNMAKDFHENNHISGWVSSSKNFGLFDDTGKLLCVMSLSKSRYDKNVEWEITRFCSLVNHTIIGGLGRLLHFFKISFSPKSIITYADLRFGEGNSYKLVGFKFDRVTPPNYFYIKNGVGYRLESRVKYQKHKLKGFKHYSPELTEFQIMELENYFRIYDCGNNRFVWGGAFT